MTFGPLIVISGPSGSGKSTLVERLLSSTGLPLRLSVSVTTRSRRPQELDGVHYHFWDRARFQEEIAGGGFLEWAEVFGNYYGTLRREVESRAQGVGVLLDIDVKGWEQVRQKCPDAVSIFIRAPSLAVYEERLRSRRTESEESLQKRLQGALAEEARISEYQHQVVNVDLDEAYQAILEIIQPFFTKG